MSKQYPLAHLSDDELTKLQQMEQEMQYIIDKDVILIAYQDTEGEKSHDQA